MCEEVLWSIIYRKLSAIWIFLQISNYFILSRKIDFFLWESTSSVALIFHHNFAFLISHLNCWLHGSRIISAASNLVFWTNFSRQNLLRSLSLVSFVLQHYKYGAKKCPKNHIRFHFWDVSTSANQKTGKTIEKSLKELPWNQQLTENMLACEQVLYWKFLGNNCLDFGVADGRNVGSSLPSFRPSSSPSSLKSHLMGMNRTWC